MTRILEGHRRVQVENERHVISMSEPQKIAEMRLNALAPSTIFKNPSHESIAWGNWGRAGRI